MASQPLFLFTRDTEHIFNMKNITILRRVLVALLVVNFLPNSFCGICQLCVCTQSEDSRIITCQGKREIDNYTEIFDLLAFDKSETVKKLVISRHDITSLPLDAFRGLKRLESLILSENSIEDIEADIFKDLKNLEELDFSSNLLKTLSGTVFNNLQSLLILNLSDNLIDDLSETSADQLPKLTSLDLSHNNLTTIDNKFVKSLSNLKFLDVSFNRIASLSCYTLLQLKSLDELRISDNLLKAIEEKDFPASLRSLDVSGNMINSLPLNLSQVRCLNIADNAIDAIGTDRLWLKKLKLLNVSGNSLTSFPDFKFNELKTLDLSRNDLSIVPRTLSLENLPILESLLIDDNPIKDLRFIEELRLLRLYARRLDRLESIETDAFARVKGIDDGCVNLTISENPRLNRITEGALNGVPICTLDLSKNAFTRISPEVIKSRNKFVASGGIDFQGNPFNCDCESQWMLNDLVPHLYTVNPELLEDLRCNKPLELSGTRMVHWFMWKRRVFCDTSPEMLSRMTLNTASVIADSGTTVRLESSREMLAIVAGAMGTLCILIIVGIIVARKLELRKRRTNRRF